MEQKLLKDQILHWTRILLIKPNYRTIGWDYYNMEFPPINLTYIASYLTDLNVKIQILDTKVKNLTSSQIRKKIEKFNPDIVGISVFVSAALKNSTNIAKIVKEVNPHCTVVFGGRHPTFESDSTLEINEVDIVVRGEGEVTFRELIINGSPYNVKGISYKYNGKVIHNPDRPLIKNFENIRFPAREFTKNYKYKMFTVRLETVETSRGCPYTCKFCTTHIFNKNLWRSRSVEKIINELKIISQNRKITDIFFVDDNLTVDTIRIENLCDKIIESKQKKEINDFKFFAQIRVDSIIRAPQMVKKMAKAGFWVVFIGIESVNEETLKEVRKGFEFKKVIEALKILHENNIIVMGNLIIGIDLEETEEEVIKEIKFMKTVDVDLVSFVLLTPFPGSDTFKELDEQRLVISKDWSKYTVFYPVIKTHQLSPKQLYDLLYFSFRELKYVNNLKEIGYRIIKTRGLLFILNPRRILTLINSFLKMRTLFKEFKKR
ncbi:MAG: B12-binding domain-containing radical SAM protein [Candidatus Odinarchaeota archaeon]